MPELEERQITFRFPQGWDVMRYETSYMHTNIMMPLQNTHAVDFICCHDGSVMLLEVKRFSERPFASSGSDLENFINEVCGQFRDTVCGIAVAKMKACPNFASYHAALFSEERNTKKITLFLELENLVAGKRREEVLADILEKLRKRFSPMGFSVRVVDAATVNSSDKCPWKAEVAPCQ